MCKELRFRKLRADEIQVRPTDTKHKGSCLLLLYQDARCAMNILDQTVGQFGWQKQYQNINGNIYCGIGIKNEDEWVWKWDAGSFTAKEDDMQSKADASDATKRAAVCWGIGRELYNTPKIKVLCPDSYYFNDKMNMSFTVDRIEWDENDQLVDLVIVDRFAHKVYDYKNGGASIFNGQDNRGMKVPPAPQDNYSIDNKASLIEFCKTTKAEIGDNEQLTKFYKYYSPKSVEWTKYRVDWSDKWSKWNQPKNAA